MNATTRMAASALLALTAFACKPGPSQSAVKDVAPPCDDAPVQRLNSALAVFSDDSEAPDLAARLQSAEAGAATAKAALDACEASVQSPQVDQCDAERGESERQDAVVDAVEAAIDEFGPDATLQSLQKALENAVQVQSNCNQQALDTQQS